MAQVAQKTILTRCKTKADATGIAPTQDWRKPLTVVDWQQEFLTGMGKWSQNSCSKLWQCFLGLDVL